MKTFRVQARVAAFVGAIVLLLFGGQISQAQAQTYSYAFQFGGPGTGDGQFGGPGSVALNASGNIIISDSDSYRIQVFDSQGIFLLSFGTPGFGCDGCLHYPLGVAVDATGNIYVADTYSSRVEVFAPGP